MNRPVWSDLSVEEDRKVPVEETTVGESVKQEDTRERTRHEQSKDSSGERVTSTWTESSSEGDSSLLTEEDFPDAGRCLSESVRNIVWPSSWPGAIVSMSCPPGSTGVATRECRDKEGPEWSDRPDLSNCQSDWIVGLRRNFRDKFSIRTVSNQLREKIRQFPLYGGDVAAVMDIAESILKNVHYVMSDLDRDDSEQIVEDLLWTFSTLLDSSLLPGWTDLPLLEYQSRRTRLIEVVQELGVLVQENRRLWRRWVSPNIGEFLCSFTFTFHSRCDS